MGFLKKLFGGGASEPQDDGLYLYVKLDRADEVVRIRINPGSELNPNEDGGGYITRKLIMGPRTFKKAEATFFFDPNRRLINSEISGGELSTIEAWQTYEATAAH